MRLEAIGTTAIMVATNPDAVKNEAGSLLPGRRMAIFRNSVGGLTDIRKLLDVTGIDGQLGDLVGDHAAKDFAPLESGG
jgi:hypothetical protein